MLEFAAAMRQAGIEPPPDIIADGVLHRFHVAGDKSGSINGWYVLYPDSPPAGAFGTWRDGVTHKWGGKNCQTMTPEEDVAYRKRIEAAKYQRKRALEQKRSEARKDAASIWVASRPAPDNYPYLQDKGVKAHGTRVDADGMLLIPMRDTSGTLHSLQRIIADGSVKRYLPGGRTQGCYYGLGRPDGVIIIAEGFATAATIHEATGHAVAAAFSAGNLEYVAKALHAKYPSMSLVIAADNDRNTKGNPGVAHGKKAAEAVGAAVVWPEFADREPGSDFNDLAALRGMDAVRKVFASAEPNSAPQETLSGLFSYVEHRTTSRGRLVLHFRHIDSHEMASMFFNVDIGSYPAGLRGQFNVKPGQQLRAFLVPLVGEPDRWCRTHRQLSHLDRYLFEATAEKKCGSWRLYPGSVNPIEHGAQKAHKKRTESLGTKSLGTKSLGTTSISNALNEEEISESHVRVNGAPDPCQKKCLNTLPPWVNSSSSRDIVDSEEESPRWMVEI